jgi:hypothetical protein
MKTNLKIITRILTVILISLSLTAFLSSCKKDSSNPAGAGTGGNGGGGGNSGSITLNGDSWSNKAITVTTGASTYGISAQITAINIVCSDGIVIVVYTPGNQTGTFNFTNDPTQGGGVTLTSGSGQTATYYLSKENAGTVTLSSYGSVGQTVSGSISGTLVNATSQAEITINGSFNATRTVDVP